MCNQDWKLWNDCTTAAKAEIFWLSMYVSLASQPLPSMLLLLHNSRNVEGRGWWRRLYVRTYQMEVSRADSDRKCYKISTTTSVSEASSPFTYCNTNFSPFGKEVPTIHSPCVQGRPACCPLPAWTNAWVRKQDLGRHNATLHRFHVSL